MPSRLSRLRPSPQVRRTVRRHLHRPRSYAVAISRVGLAARTGFYLLLVILIARLALASHAIRQTNAHGAIITIANEPFGLALLVTTAAGFGGFGVTRLWVAWKGEASSVWIRCRTTLQGLFYLSIAWIPLSYTLGNHSAGNEQQQHQTVADLLHLPGGPVLVFCLGLVVCGISAYQVRTGLGRDYLDGMAIGGAPQWVQRLMLASGTVGIPARALVFLPVGVFLMIAAVQGDPARADGLDRELTALTRSAWGEAVLSLCVVGLLIFTVYSGLEARYREVAKDQ